MNSEFHALIQRYIDGEISPEEMTALNARLLNDSEARREWIEVLNLDSAVAEAAAGWDSSEVPIAPFAARKLPVTQYGRATLAVSLTILVAFGWVWFRQNEGGGLAMATVHQQLGVAELPEGTKLGTEWRRIDAGAVTLVTALGAKVVVESPAEFRFESAQRLQLRRGRLAADVPEPAKGFTVQTPSGDVIDLGTRFGVDVLATGSAEVHVFQGKVIANPIGAGKGRSLQSGDAATMIAGETAAHGLRSSAFLQSAEMSDLSEGFSDERLARSARCQSDLRSDPTLIALLDFESADPLEGVYRLVQGRWPGTRAAEFTNVGDHMKIDVGGDRELPQLTLSAWVRLDRLGAPYQSLLHTDGWNRNNPGQVHWMVTRHTTMRLALFGNTLAPGSEEADGFPDSRASVLPEQGRWIHLATVYDSHARTVRFYLNGRFDNETRQEIAHPAKLGPARIGNWDHMDRKLSGRIDELVLLGRAMTDEEIQTVYSSGNPYRCDSP